MADRYIDDKGYYRFKNSDILVHRWAAEKKIGRKLRDNEVVHHKNANKLDNSPENLEVKTWSNHEFEHRVKALAFGGKPSYGHVNREKDSYGLDGRHVDKMKNIINSNPLKSYNPLKSINGPSKSRRSRKGGDSFSLF